MCKLSATKRAASAIAVTLAVLVLMMGLACAKAEAPQAEFKGDPLTGLVPLTVSFTDQSTGEITSWKWNFGDGKTDTARNPSHTYTAAGEYNVSLVVEGPGGKKDTKTKLYYVYVLRISEAANAEVNEAQNAITQCMTDAGAVELLAAVTGWDGSAGMVEASGSGGTKDAASYLEGGTFKAKYDVDKNGNIIHGTDVSWGGIKWSGEKPVWWLDVS